MGSNCSKAYTAWIIHSDQAGSARRGVRAGSMQSVVTLQQYFFHMQYYSHTTVPSKEVTASQLFPDSRFCGGVAKSQITLVSPCSEMMEVLDQEEVLDP